MKQPKRKMDWKGLQVVSQRPFSNRLGEMPAGTIYMVTGVTPKGLDLNSEPCKCCSFRLNVFLPNGLLHEVYIPDLVDNFEALAENEKWGYEKGRMGRRLVKKS